MEIYSNTTRFALACNQSTKVIEPIQSRCAIIRFGRLSDQEILSRIMFVCQQEKVSYPQCSPNLYSHHIYAVIPMELPSPPANHTCISSLLVLYC